MPHGPPSSSPGGVAEAPGWHGALLVLALVGLAWGDWLLGAPAVSAENTNRPLAYLSMAIGSAGFALFASGWGRRRLLVGRPWGSSRALPLDLALSALLIASVLVAHALGNDSNTVTTAILPRSPLERLLWTASVLVVACAEELIFRSYLLNQLARRFGSPALAVLLQAAIFGLCHVSQGAAEATRIAAYGVLFGLVAWRRGNITACVIAHFAIDALAGLGA